MDIIPDCIHSGGIQKETGSISASRFRGAWFSYLVFTILMVFIASFLLVFSSANTVQ